MNAMTVGIDLAKNVFELAFADEQHRIIKRERLSRAQFARRWVNQPPLRVVMEACGSAHHWARKLQQQGHQVQLLPAQYVRAYVRRNKTDAADAAALIEASRCADIHPVPVKSMDQQVLQQLHRLREQYKHTRTQRMNLLRGTLREYGVTLSLGMQRGLREISQVLAQPEACVPQALHSFIQEVVRELTELEQKIHHIEDTLEQLTAEDATVRRLKSIPGVGKISATALRASVGDVQRFPSGRHLACYVGLTSREYSSGEHRRLGSISKQGDGYLRMLLVHGARAVLAGAQRMARVGKPLDRLRTWAVALQQRQGTNKATVALANKLARIVWATWRHERTFDGNWARASG
jgi:transposase